jgi:transposase
MANPPNRVEIITPVQRRRRWTAAEKVRMVEETLEPGMTVSLAAFPRSSCLPAPERG